MEETMQLRIDPSGQVRCVYGEAIDLAVLGALTIRRASHVEPDDQGHWWADLTPVNGPRVGPFPLRSQALTAEVAWLEQFLFAEGPAANAESGRSSASALLPSSRSA
jgi:hypothetical protein